MNLSSKEMDPFLLELTVTFSCFRLCSHHLTDVSAKSFLLQHVRSVWQFGIRGWLIHQEISE